MFNWEDEVDGGTVCWAWSYKQKAGASYIYESSAVSQKTSGISEGKHLCIVCVSFVYY